MAGNLPRSSRFDLVKHTGVGITIFLQGSSLHLGLNPVSVFYADRQIPYPLSHLGSPRSIKAHLFEGEGGTALNHNSVIDIDDR